MMDLYFQLAGLVFLIVLSAFFAATEVAFTGLSLPQINRIKRFNPKAIRVWERNPDRVLATLLLSNNAVNTGAGVLATGMGIQLARLTGWNPDLTGLACGFVASLAVLVFGEVLPKIGARYNTTSWAMSFGPLMTAWSRIVAPFAVGAERLTKAVLPGPMRSKGPLFLRPAELRRILVHATIPVSSKRILTNVMEFSSSTAAEVMTPAAHMFSIPAATPWSKIIPTVTRSGFSRIPVFSGSRDNIVGILYAKDLLVAWRSGTLLVLEDLLRPVRVVDHDRPLPELLRDFRRGGQHIAIVTERGTRRVLGLVTLQDALEAIVGPIKEEL